jgi:hypothetical protein
MRLDFTLTLPGMFEVDNIQQLAVRYDVDLLAKVIFSFTPDIILSPLSLPRHLLDPWVENLAQSCTSGAMRDVLLQLKQRPTFEEQWPTEYKDALIRGKQRVLNLEKVRNDSYTLENILSQDTKIYEWYKNIG